MTNAYTDKKYIRPRTLLFSQRNIHKNFLFRCPYIEFEDIIRQIDSVELLAPQPKKSFHLSHAVAKRIAWHSPIFLNPGIPGIKVKENYDLFFAVCASPADLLTVNTLKNWRDYCKTAICLVDELWIKEIHAYRYFFELLSKFDFVMLYYSQSVKPVSEVIGPKCFFLPPGIDAILFCPCPEPPKRVIDVYSIGRKAEGTHRKLLEMLKEKKIFYVYDSKHGDLAINSEEHRLLLANTAKRSRYFIVNPGLIDQPEIRGDQSEMGNRYFEGAASGTITIGEYPKNEEFEKLFNWPDAVIQLPFGSDSIDTIINDLDKQPDRQEKIRRNNVVQSLLHHDWVYRWETILETAGLKPMPELFERKKRLENLSRMVETEMNWCR